MDFIRSSPATSHHVRLSPAVLRRLGKSHEETNSDVFSAELGDVNICLTAYNPASLGLQRDVLMLMCTPSQAVHL
jgi:hypothetical protein